MLFGSTDRLQISVNKEDAVELRLDRFDSVEIDLLRALLQKSIRPILFTLRRAPQENESDRERLIEKLLELEPPFFDLEYDMRPEFLQKVFRRYRKTKFLLSYHNFQEVPSHLEEIYLEMSKYQVFSYKIAAMASSTNDALRMLLFAKKHPKTSAICMGEKGAFARVLGPIMGNLVGYGRMDGEQETGPGQLTISELVDVYHYPSLTRETAVYGLIGDPVEKSPGHLYHNAVFRKRRLNAVYVKMNVGAEELSEFIPLAKEIGIRGLSVTIPLKEKILPFVDEIQTKEIGAVNTLLFQDGKIIGTNTDGLGALDAIEKRLPVRGRKVVLLGAGGTARAIAFEAKARGADVVILNRTIQRAKELAVEFGCEAGGLDEVPSRYDLLVNCSPDPMPIDPKKIRSETVAMDVVYSPKETPFLKEALSRGCQIIYGEEMFLNQAVRQTDFWLGSC